MLGPPPTKLHMTVACLQRAAKMPTTETGNARAVVEAMLATIAAGDKGAMRDDARTANLAARVPAIAKDPGSAPR